MAILFISLLVAIVIVVISVVYLREREARLRGYSGVTRDEFVEHFNAQGIPARISEITYDTFKEKASFEEFMPAPDMDIDAVFEQLEEDTDDDLRHILEALEIPYPDEETCERWSGAKVRTISDLVVWIDWVRREYEGNLHSPRSSNA
jgi:hypothetical protein